MEENEKKNQENLKEDYEEAIIIKHLPMFLALASFALSFLRVFFATVVSGTVSRVFAIIFFTFAFGCAFTSLIIMVVKNKKCKIDLAMILNIIALVVTFL